ncbi:uncharacterized protein (TIGR02285 family) [Pseudomonas sp. LP_7_YM]|nr:uncharacterized protein (TIGR02285 family) [Pseudomonas sp. LP_7_YM]
MKVIRWSVANSAPLGRGCSAVIQFFRGLHQRMVNRYSRHRKHGLLVLLLAAVLGSLPDDACARETLIWLLRDFPPLTIFAGTQSGQGAIDQLMPELIARMPQYDHQIMHVNRARGTQMLQDPEVFACDPTLLWTPKREKTTLFSIPIYAINGNGVTIERSKHALFAPFLRADGHLDLAALLESNTVKTGIVAERSYGPVIDDILRNTTRPENLILHYGNSAVGSMVQMERLGRFQAIISYWPEARYQAQQQGIAPDELEFFPVKDTPKYQFAHIGCSKTDKGREAVAIINREMRTLRTTRLIPFFTQWAIDKQQYRQDALTFFDQSQH